jgi:hypothetical protein
MTFKGAVSAYIKAAQSGSGANGRHEQTLPSTPCSPKRRVPDCRRSSALNAQTPQSDLSLADAMHQLDAGDRDRRIPGHLKPSITAMRCFTPRWSCSIRLFDERSFVSADNKPSAFSSRTAR